MKALLIFLFCPLFLLAQELPDCPPSTVYQDDATFFLADFCGGWSVGNPCDVGNYMVINCYDNMDMNFQVLDVYHADITIHGEVLDEGTINFMCDTSVVTILGETLSNEGPQEMDYDINMYPNPATDHVNIKGQNIEQITFYNISGQKVKDYTTPMNNNRVQLGNLNPGIYLVYIIGTNNHHQTLKLIIK